MRAAYSGGLAVQIFASATNLGLSIMAGHAAGPAGLGVVYAGFAAYAAAFGLQRALVTTPLVAVTSAASTADRRRATAAALTLVGGSGLLCALVFCCAGLIIGGAFGRGLVVFSPWVAFALVQQFWRATFFRDGRTKRALANEVAWFVTLVVGAPLALGTESETAVVAVWGLGAAIAAVLAWTAYRSRPLSPRLAGEWWRRDAAGFGSWLALQEVVFVGVGFTLVVAMAALLGSEGLGGMRAAETVFAPISLIAPAIALPGLPAMVRARGHSEYEAMRLARRLSGAAVAFTIGYLVLMVALSGSILDWFFGPGFDEYGTLVWPMGIWQILTATALGFGILLQAERRGSALAAAGVSGSVGSLLLVSVLAFEFGVVGAAWGLTAGTAVAATITVTLAVKGNASS